MDLSQLLTILSNTVNPSVGNDVMRQSEKALESIECLPGYLPYLLQLTQSADISQALQHAIVLRLKNIIDQHWRFVPEDYDMISEQDREQVRAQLYEAIVHQTHSVIRKQLLQSLYYVCQADFPDRWTTLIPQAFEGFKTQDLNRIHASASVFYQIFKRYRLKMDDQPEAILDVMAQVLPALLEVGQYFVSMESTEGYEITRMILKNLRAITEYYLPPFLREKRNITPWIDLLMTVMSKPEPAQLAALDDEARSTHPFWLCKKTASKVLARVFTRYGQPSTVEQEFAAFATLFTKSLATKPMNLFVSFLEARVAGVFVSDRVINSAFMYLYEAIKVSTMFKALRKKILFIMCQSIIGVLQLNQKDIDMWTEDPHEFIRRDSDFSCEISSEYQDPRVSAVNLLIDLVRTRTKYTLDDLLNFLSTIINEYASAPADPENQRKKEVAMRVIGSINLILQEKTPDSVEPLLVAHIIPELSNGNGFLRVRALWTLNRFSSHAFEDQAAANTMINGILGLMKDSDLPVRVEACNAIVSIIRDSEDPAPFEPAIPLILEGFFGVIEEVGSEDVVIAFDALIAKFGQHIAPYAVQMVQRLVSVFMSALQADLDSDEEAVLAAMGCMRAVNTVLHSIHKLPHSYEALEPILLPMLDVIFQKEAMDFFDDALECITCLTYYPDTISESMWSFLPRILESFDSYAADYISSMIHPIDNYIVRGTERFLSIKQPNVLEGVLSVIGKILSEKNMEVEGQYAAKMCESIIVACRGHIDPYYPTLFKLIVEKLGHAKDLSLKFLLFNAVAACAYYNPALFLQQCSALGCTEFIFNQWLSHVPEMKSGFQRRVAAIGLSSFCHVDPSQYPPQLAEAFHHVLLKVLELLVPVAESEKGDDEEDGDDDIADDEDFIDNDEDGDAEEDDDEDGAQIIDTNEDEDVVNEEDQAYMEALFKKVRSGFNDGMDDDGIDDEDFESPFEDINAFIFFAQAWQVYGQLQPQHLQQFTSSLPTEQASLLQSHLQKASDDLAEAPKAQ